MFQHVLARLRNGLAKWLDQAREAGLETEDVEALFASVIVENPAGRRRNAAEGAA